MKKILFTVAVVISLCVANYAQEIRRPAAETDSLGVGCTATNAEAAPSMAYFYDSSGESTSSSDVLLKRSSGTETYKRGKTFSGFSSGSGPYSSLSLITRTTCSRTTLGMCRLEYSTNGGSSWLAIRSANSWTDSTDTTTLDPSQDLSLLRVRYCHTGGGSNSSTTGTTFTGTDARTEGALASTDKKRFQVTTTE